MNPFLFFFAINLLIASYANALPTDFDNGWSFMKNDIISDWLNQANNQPQNHCEQEKNRINRLLTKKDLQIKDLEKYKILFEKIKQLPNSEQTYIELRKLKRAIMFSAKENNFDEIICVDAPYPAGSEAPHESRFKTENTAVYGASLLRVNIKEQTSKRLAPSTGKSAAIWKIDLNFDANKIVFQMRESDKTNNNLYCVDVDGKNLKCISNSEYNDVDPAWLPDDNIVFCTSRANCYVRCGGSAFRSTILARCDADGKNIYFISTNNEADFMPSVMSDGSVLYTRWEYVDKNIFRLQSLWTVNPDGSNPQVFWGGQSHYPDLKIGAYQVPDSDKIIFMTSSHHNVFNSGLAILKPSEGRNYPDGIYNLTPHLGWTEAQYGSWNKTKCGPWDKSYSDMVVPSCYGSFYSPFPISKNFYLASASLTIQNFSDIPQDAKPLKLYLCDYDGNMELLYSGQHNIVHAQPLMKRSRPRIIPLKNEFLGYYSPDKNEPRGVLYSADVFKDSGIPREKGKYLRVIEHCAATYQDGVPNSYAQCVPVLKKWYNTKWSLPIIGVYSSQSPKNTHRIFGFLSGETTMSIFMDESHKRILGEVEIEKDGSVCVEIPAMKAVYFQILDKDKKVLQTMRSSTHVVAGENRGCLGCHATKFKTAPNMHSAMALRKYPKKLNKPFGDITFGFNRYVQPILDKYCISCHNRESGNKLNLCSDKFQQSDVFTESYLNLVLGVPTGDLSTAKPIAGAISPYAVYKSLDENVPTSESTIAPMQVLSYTSPLIERLEKGHANVKLSDRDLSILKAWIDLNCPYYGEEDVLEMDDINEETYNKSKRAFMGLSYPPKMKTCPDVDRAFRQDKFKTQSDRNPKDENGNVLPAIKYENGIRKVFK